MYNIHTRLFDSLTQLPSEAVQVNLLWEGPEALLVGRQLVALWEEGGYTMRRSTLLRFHWSFKVSFKSHELSLACC